MSPHGQSLLVAETRVPGFPERASPRNGTIDERSRYRVRRAREEARAHRDAIRRRREEGAGGGEQSSGHLRRAG